MYSLALPNFKIFWSSWHFSNDLKINFQFRTMILELTVYYFFLSDNSIKESFGGLIIKNEKVLFSILFSVLIPILIYVLYMAFFCSYAHLLSLFQNQRTSCIAFCSLFKDIVTTGPKAMDLVENLGPSSLMLLFLHIASGIVVDWCMYFICKAGFLSFQPF